MDGTSRVEAGAIGPALDQMLEAYPDAKLAAVNDSGLFVELPPALAQSGHAPLAARAGIELVAPECRKLVLDQFRQLAERGACEVEVTLLDGSPARYALFDTRALHGVVTLVLVEGEVDEAVHRKVALAEMVAVRPRYGTIRRTEVAELLAVDDATLVMTGYDEAEFGSLDASTLVHPDDQGAVIGQWFDVLALEPGKGRTTRIRYRRRDGSWLWVELTVTNRTDDPHQPHMFSEVVDISEEMAAIDEVWKHRELLFRLTEALPLGVVQIDADRKVVYTNDRLARIVGVRDAETLSDQFAAVVDDDRERLDEAVSAALEHGPDIDLELRFRPGRSRSVRYSQTSIRVLRDRSDVITGAVICVSDVTDSTRMRKELEMRATYDVLTKTFNRASVMAEIERALADRRNGTAVVFVDLDGFKAVNDTHGHAAGDQLLRSVAAALDRVVRSGDVVGRFGGDEFVVLCADVAERARSVEIADRIADALRFDVEVGDTTVAVRASIGVAWTSGDLSAEGLVAAADAAMYDCKRSGTTRPVLYADRP
jgi:diguanylate cyclase (GGDEF)-like protein/PAS domain S-box-containing protein